VSEELKQALVAKGVSIPRPDLVVVDPDVDPERIESGAILLPGARISGSRTLMRSGARIGTGGAAVVHDCALGRDATLASGSFTSCVLLDGASFGPSGHGRDGTLFEEEASAAHAVGTKQTILLPWATVGSNVNGCDLLLAGGTGRNDHSEIGSGFIHFNFTPFGPRGDKATPSLFGNVRRGVWLTERRIFLGGAGGVVGPIRVGYGSVLAAGAVYRRDHGDDVLVVGEKTPEREVPFDPFMIRRGPDRVRRSLEFMAELVALHRWYAEVRMRRAADDLMQRLLLGEAMTLLEAALAERARQLERFIDGFEVSADHLEPRGEVAEAGHLRSIAKAFPRIRSAITHPLGIETRQEFDRIARGTLLAAAAEDLDQPYIDWVQGLDETVRAAGRGYLTSIVEAYLKDPVGAGALR